MAWNGNRPNASSTTAPVAAPPAAPSVPATGNSGVAGTPFDPNDAASPFFLHPNENPSLILVSTLLDGRNYHPWARAMEMSLLSKNKLGFVDGTISMPNIGEVKYPYWKRCNNMVATWIMQSVSSEIAHTILWVGTAERIWNTLKARFSEADIFRISDLQAEIHQIRQGDLTVSAYFAKLKVLWDELQVIRPLPVCKCEKRCDCGLMQTLEQQLESDNLSVFLRGLNDSYASVQSQIMMTKPLPSVDEAFMMVQQQERRFNNAGGPIQETGSIMFTQGNSRKYPSNNSNKRPVCSCCGYTGHTAEKCYKKHGYPPGWKPRNKAAGYANQMQLNSEEQPLSGKSGSVTLSQDEYKLLRQLLHKDNIAHSQSDCC
ncbi:PREDICTED: uncharacterized protein LOC109153764 [Ipomoea nil]|uniref:uncharacterized protein LOC109153764 n=1 Tax=Ipomoea nil TaxID=35883 RepID=UPI000900A783|nr:PREDICTED: uncharacterized protein LOC109153764 [Ipomoea nil]